MKHELNNIKLGFKFDFKGKRAFSIVSYLDKGILYAFYQSMIYTIFG